MTGEEIINFGFAGAGIENALIRTLQNIFNARWISKSKSNSSFERNNRYRKFMSEYRNAKETIQKQNRSKQ
jgi:hypothetical protein